MLVNQFLGNNQIKKPMTSIKFETTIKKNACDAHSIEHVFVIS